MPVAVYDLLGPGVESKLVYANGRFVVNSQQNFSDFQQLFLR